MEDTHFAWLRIAHVIASAPSDDCVKELAASMPDRATFAKGLAAAASFFHERRTRQTGPDDFRPRYRVQLGTVGLDRLRGSLAARRSQSLRPQISVSKVAVAMRPPRPISNCPRGDSNPEFRKAGRAPVLSQQQLRRGVRSRGSRSGNGVGVLFARTEMGTSTGWVRWTEAVASSMERLVQRVSALSRGGPKMRRVEKREALSIE